MNIEDVQETIDQIAVNLPMAYQNKQKLLEAVSLNGNRMRSWSAFLAANRGDP